MTIPAKVIDYVVKWIDKNLDQPLRIDHIALYSGYSKWHLQRLFLKHKGESLGRYIRKRKLFMAAQDLRNTDVKICDISIKYGYESQQTFTRIFTRTFHYPPGLYRHINKSDKDLSG
ncbi:RamA family antibiotic efflux transcriptional regulator [Klebsiella oxytoca]